jgi:hypothetical protein
MKTPTKPMKLTTANLEKCGWLFTATMGVMVREHECGGGKWDIEVECYNNVGTSNDPCWEPRTNIVYPAFTTVAEVIKYEPSLGVLGDWIHGDDVEML